MSKKNKLTECKHCGQTIAKAAKVCPHCGGRNRAGAGTLVLGVICVVIGLSLMACGIGGIL